MAKVLAPILKLSARDNVRRYGSTRPTKSSCCPRSATPGPTHTFLRSGPSCDLQHRPGDVHRLVKRRRININWMASLPARPCLRGASVLVGQLSRNAVKDVRVCSRDGSSATTDRSSAFATLSRKQTGLFCESPKFHLTFRISTNASPVVFAGERWKPGWVMNKEQKRGAREVPQGKTSVVRRRNLEFSINREKSTPHQQSNNVPVPSSSASRSGPNPSTSMVPLSIVTSEGMTLPLSLARCSSSMVAPVQQL
jgi:hypothetical protein